MNNCYRTVKNEAASEFSEKKSRFIGHICPVTTEDEALAHLNRVKAAHPSANHNCYAYILRENNTVRFSDNGEPSGTAGKPMLEMLLREEIKDVCVVVTRYFGGTLLGTGGLARAYTKGAKDALTEGGICTMTECGIFLLSSPYNMKERVESLISAHTGELLEQEFGVDIAMRFFLPMAEVLGFEAELTELTNGKVKAEVIGTEYRGI